MAATKPLSDLDQYRLDRDSAELLALQEKAAKRRVEDDNRDQWLNHRAEVVESVLAHPPNRNVLSESADKLHTAIVAALVEYRAAHTAHNAEVSGIKAQCESLELVDVLGPVSVKSTGPRGGLYIEGVFFPPVLGWKDRATTVMSRALSTADRTAK